MRNPLRSLYGRLATVLLLLLVLFAALSLWTTFRTSWTYSQAMQQQLHRHLAQQLVEKDILMIAGKIQEPQLNDVFHTLMVINPSIEVYLLDASGLILQYHAPPGEVKRQRISLGPIQEFLEPDAKLPIVGDDPRSDDRRKVFSVAPIHGADGHEGYLYIIIGSEEQRSILRGVVESEILRLASLWTVAILAATLVCGLLLFGLLTRRLRRLATAMQSFEASGFQSDPPVELRAGREAGGTDEIALLSHTFHEMANSISRQIRELERMDALRRELVANVSHDLRTPLTHIQGYLETLLLREGAVPLAERRSYLEIALKQSQRLGELIGDLFELAKLEAEAADLHREVFSLTELAQDVVQKFRLARRNEAVLEAHLPHDLALVEADVGLVERVLENLVGNALRHTPPEGQVHLSVESRPSGFLVRVDDTGKGIPAEDLPQIFRRYFRREGDAQSPSERQSGAGLGLAIARRIVELHGSELDCSSEPGKGTCFSFTLPPAAGPAPPPS